MIHQREGYRFVILEPAKTWIEQGKCAGCGKPKSEWKRTTKYKCCSTACTTKMQVNYQYFGWNQLREKAFERDNYTCKHCGKQPEIFNTPVMGHNWKQHASIQLIGDHILPIALGGNEWSIENVQTLCKKCNKIKTAQDIKKIAIERKIPATQNRLE